MKGSFILAIASISSIAHSLDSSQLLISGCPWYVPHGSQILITTRPGISIRSPSDGMSDFKGLSVYPISKENKEHDCNRINKKIGNLCLVGMEGAGIWHFVDTQGAYNVYFRNYSYEEISDLNVVKNCK